jgi:hypothetical protein
MRFPALPLLLLAACACSSGHANSDPTRGRAFVVRAGSPAKPGEDARIVMFTGTCDASGAVPIDARLFAVANDENNVLRIYDAEGGGAPLHAIDLSPQLHLTKKQRNTYAESDIEAATRLGDTALWLSSHARSKKGKLKPDRFRFFATDLPRPGATVAVRGQVYTALLADLLREPQLAPFELAEASRRPPEAEGGLNIEGITEMPGGRALLGFRNPIRSGRALLLPMLNPLDPFRGKPLRFGAPVSLDLGGLGVRSLSYWHGKYLIAAGPHAGGVERRLYTWSGPGTAPEPIVDAAIGSINPEAFFTPEEREHFMVLSDDGSRAVDGERCKDLDDDRQKTFRGLWIR